MAQTRRLQKCCLVWKSSISKKEQDSPGAKCVNFIEKTQGLFPMPVSPAYIIKMSSKTPEKWFLSFIMNESIIYTDSSMNICEEKRKYIWPHLDIYIQLHNYG